MKVLVVDDEPIICEGIKMILTKKGYETDTLVDPEKVASAFEKTRYDLMFIDLLMPKLSGIELIVWVGKHYPDTLVVLISGYATIKTAIQAIQSGAFDYIPKPFTEGELINILLRAKKRYDLGEPGKLRLDPGKKGKIRFFGDHSWVLTGKKEEWTIGLNPHFLETIGRIRTIDFPPPGSETQQGAVCVKLTNADNRVYNIWSPASGRITELNQVLTGEFPAFPFERLEDGWLCKIAPISVKDELENLNPFEL